MDEIEQRLAGVSRRLEARRALVRSQLETRPELSAWLDALRDHFQARLSYLEIGDFRDGDPDRITEIDGRPGVVFCPAPYHRPSTTRRGKAATMRAREAAGQ